MTRRSRWIVAGTLLALAGAGGGWAIYRSVKEPPQVLPTPPARADVLDTIPAGALFLLTVDLEALRASPLGGALAGPAKSSWLGDVRATCGFEPLDSLTQLALVVPVGGADGDLGIVGAGSVDAPALTTCATKVIEARGGKAAKTQLGSFTSIRDISEASAKRGGGGEIAVKPGGPLLIGAGNFMRSLVDAADGAVASIRSDQAHAALRLAVGEDSLARFTAVLSAEQRATIADEVDRSSGRAPPVLKALVAAGLGLRVSSETVQLHAVALLTGDAEATQFRDDVDALRNARAENPLLRFLGVGSLLERIQIRVEGKSVHLTLAMTIVEANNLIDKLTALGAPPPAPVPSPSPSTSTSSAPSSSTSSAPSSATSSAPSSAPSILPSSPRPAPSSAPRAPRP